MKELKKQLTAEDKAAECAVERARVWLSNECTDSGKRLFMEGCRQGYTIGNKEVEQLREALQFYGKHGPSCYYIEIQDFWECKCGLSQYAKTQGEK